MTFNHSQWQVSHVKQGTLTLQEDLVPHPLQKCFIEWVFTGYAILIDYFERFMTLITDSDMSAGTFIIKKFCTYENTAFI